MARIRKTINHLSLTKARATFGDVLKRVHLNHEYFILEKNGVPVVGILNGDELIDYMKPLADDTLTPAETKQVWRGMKHIKDGCFIRR